MENRRCTVEQCEHGYELDSDDLGDGCLTCYQEAVEVLARALKLIRAAHPGPAANVAASALQEAGIPDHRADYERQQEWVRDAEDAGSRDV